jgi:hypothetical protein
MYYFPNILTVIVLYINNLHANKKQSYMFWLVFKICEYICVC